MSYKKEFLDQIIEINKLLNDNKENDLSTLQKIKDYLNSIKSIGYFSSDTWNIQLRKELYKFGEFFEEKNPEKVFTLINDEITSSLNDSELEILEFIKTEVFINFFTEEESIIYLKEIIDKYKMNPEFRNTLSLLYKQKSDIKQAIKYAKQALKIEPNNNVWLDSLYQLEYGFGKKLIEEKKHDEANEFLKEIVNSNFYKKNRNSHYQNFFIFLRQRNDDQLLIESKLLEIDKSSKKEIESLFEKSRIKIIELLGFFTAIIAFIFGAITITVKTDLQSALVLITSFGLIMLIFILALSIVFIKTDKKIYEDKRFYLLIFILFINISLIYLGNPLTELLKTIWKI